jgi:hypothetical protein
MIQTWFGVRQGADQLMYLGTLGIQHSPIFIVVTSEGYYRENTGTYDGC